MRCVRDTGLDPSSSTYDVYYYINDGTNDVANPHVQQVPINAQTNLTKNVYTRNGYNFVGWNTKRDGTGTSYKDEQLVNNLASTPWLKSTKRNTPLLWTRCFS